MKDFTRGLTRYIRKNRSDLEKMVFVVGPRQVGKTTVLKGWPETLSLEPSFYLNWDIPNDRKLLHTGSLDFFEEKILSAKEPPFFILDEIHKYPRWKNFLKGFFDAFKDRMYLAVTGSASLGTYRRGGDSLLGRYWLFHLYPLTVAEILGESCFALPAAWKEENSVPIKKAYQKLYAVGGFPEPFFKLSEKQYRRWGQLRRELLVREDLRDLSRVVELSRVEQLLEILPSKVGAPFSLNSVREDLEISHSSLQNWLKWLKALYYFFSIPVYSKRLARSLKKEEKIYLYDWAEIEEPGARFENLVALHLMKAVQNWREMSGENLALYYLRDKEKREVDFLIVRNKKVWMLIESKLQADFSPSALAYYAERLKPEHVVLLTHEWISPQWKIFKNTRYWLSPAGTFFSNWV